MMTVVSANDLRNTLTAGTGIRNAPITKLVGPQNEIYDLLAPRSSHLSVGRSDRCAITLPYPTISRHQCSLDFSDGRVLLTHWPRAKNITFVDGVPIPHHVDLRFGNRVRFGDIGGVEFIAFADSDEIQDIVALRAFEDVGTTYAAAAHALGVDKKKFTRRVRRAQALYDGLAGVIPTAIIDDDNTPRRHRSAGESVYGIPTTGEEGGNS